MGSSSSSPRSSPDPATNISHRVDSRYTEDISPRVSLSSQHHASKTMQVAGGAGYSVARVTETRKRMEIRGLNLSTDQLFLLLSNHLPLKVKRSALVLER